MWVPNPYRLRLASNGSGYGLIMTYAVQNVSPLRYGTLGMSGIYVLPGIVVPPYPSLGNQGKRGTTLIIFPICYTTIREYRGIQGTLAYGTSKDVR